MLSAITLAAALAVIAWDAYEILTGTRPVVRDWVMFAYSFPLLVFFLFLLARRPWRR